MSLISANILRTLQFNQLKLQSILLGCSQKYCSSVGSFLQYDKDPGPQFVKVETQRLLKSMTRMRLDKVFRRRSVVDNTIDYKFMTSEQIEHEIQQSIQQGERLLQMPPIVQIKEDVERTISEDPGLNKFSDSQFVFTDITYGVTDSQRTIVIRHENGQLQTAPHSVRKRINQLYFPLPGRKMRSPQMFSNPDEFKRCLNEKKYEFILDRLCVEYEPYELKFHEFCGAVFQHINEHKQFDDLRSTRHFGPMAFFLAWHKIIDDLLYDMIKRDYLRNGVELIALMFNLNGISYDQQMLSKLREFPVRNDVGSEWKTTDDGDNVKKQIEDAIGKNGDDFRADDYCLEVISAFVKEHALKKTPLELALQSYRETQDEKRRLYEGLSKAHGVQQVN